MENRILLCVLAAVLAVTPGARGDLTEVPQNVVTFDGTETIVLPCEAAADTNARVMWFEFVLNPNGLVISDNRLILPSHPNNARYTILGSGTTFNLQISNVSIFDGGRYRCQDINGSPPAFFRGSAELIVMNTEPKCNEFSTLFGTVVEGRRYQTECEFDYQSQLIRPNMTWSGPGVFQSFVSITNSFAWSYSAFDAQRIQQDGRFECLTHFPLLPLTELPEDGATNVPDYQHVFQGTQLNVVWPPQELDAVPIKPIYDVGDQITCSADANPTATFRWTNMRTGIQNPVGAVFTITEDLEGSEQVLRCNAYNLIEGGLNVADRFINVTVREATTTAEPTTTLSTTPPPEDAPCGDLTGHWSSSNPSAHICLEVDSKGNMLVLIRNGSDPFFVAGNGKTQYNDYKHVGFSAVWPPGLGGVGGFTGECHNCYGNEVILLSGLSRDKANAPGCGQSDGTHFTPLYVLTRFGPPCREMKDMIYNPTPAHIKHFGIAPEKVIKMKSKQAN